MLMLNKNHEVGIFFFMLKLVLMIIATKKSDENIFFLLNFESFVMLIAPRKKTENKLNFHK